ncbi:MAG: efflux RND transporter periplasmic adaptor subunit [Clostridium sp.]|uniref:efflux RND transporter periplasmic adaptor subunit n=1 Tax=Clostridium sp. TaxID=1506 RepID=UPI003F3358CC
MNKRKIIKIISVVVVFIGFVGLYISKINKKEGAENYTSDGIAIMVSSLEKGNIEEYIKFFGSIKGGEEENITPAVSAKVTSVNVKDGDYVEKGDILMTLDSSEVDKQIEDVKKFYDKSLKVATESKNKIKSLEVTEEKLEDEIKEKNKEYVSIENLNKGIKKELSELDEKYKKEEISKEEFFKVQQELNKELNKNNVKLGAISKEILGKELSIKTLDETLKKIKESNVDGNSNVSINKVYDNVLKLKEGYVVKAPISGYVKDSNVVVGDSGLNPFMPAMIVSNMSTVSFDILVPENMIQDFKVGKKVKVEADSKDGIIKETGEVKYISNKKDKKTNQYTVTVNLNNKNEKIERNNYAKAFISKNSKTDVFLISKNAVFREEGKSYVYIVKDEIATKREITLGAEDDDNVEIIEGITKENEVILRGKEFVKEGDKVTVVRGEMK